MALRYDRDRKAAVTLTGGKRIHFPRDTYEVRLATLEEERELAESYTVLELVKDERYDDEDDGAEAEEVDADVDALAADAEEADEDEEDVELCGVEKVNGEPCERPVDECQYHDVLVGEDADSEE